MGRAVCIVLLTYFFLSTDAQKDLEDKLQSIFGSNDNIPNSITDKKSDILNCECVPYYLCNEDKKIITDGRTLIDIRELGDCESALEVCCNPPDKANKPIIPTQETKKGCGFRNVKGAGFHITGGQNNETQFGEFPWMVAILAEESTADMVRVFDVYKCGGALIHPKVVLTGAHCVASQEKKYKVRAGEWDTQTTKEIFPHQDCSVKSVVIHSNYNPRSLFNDVALVFLESPFDITENVNTLCLPEQNVVVPSGTRCFAAGWGKDVFSKKGIYQVILKKIDLPMVDSSTCQQYLRTTRLGRHFQLDKSFVCAGGEKGKDTCKGDGGSPLMCPIPGEQDRYQQVGMVAWGIGCGDDKMPGVYVNVGLFRRWIDEQIGLHGLDISSYQY